MRPLFKVSLDFQSTMATSDVHLANFYAHADNVAKSVTASIFATSGEPTNEQTQVRSIVPVASMLKPIKEELALSQHLKVDLNDLCTAAVNFTSNSQFTQNLTVENKDVARDRDRDADLLLANASQSSLAHADYDKQ